MFGCVVHQHDGAPVQSRPEFIRCRDEDRHIGIRVLIAIAAPCQRVKEHRHGSFPAQFLLHSSHYGLNERVTLLRSREGNGVRYVEKGNALVGHALRRSLHVPGFKALGYLTGPLRADIDAWPLLGIASDERLSAGDAQGHVQAEERLCAARRSVDDGQRVRHHQPPDKVFAGSVCQLASVKKYDAEAPRRLGLLFLLAVFPSLLPAVAEQFPRRIKPLLGMNIVPVKPLP